MEESGWYKVSEVGSCNYCDRYVRAFLEDRAKAAQEELVAVLHIGTADGYITQLRMCADCLPEQRIAIRRELTLLSATNPGRVRHAQS